MKERILITVKTYPVLSKKYRELVCTAGVTESGEWRRLFPIQFRALYGTNQTYKKYQWIEAELEKSSKDKRPESYRIVGNSLRTEGKPLSSANHWSARKSAFLNKVELHDDLARLIARAHDNELSLGAFRPARILDFKWKPVEREWDPDTLAELEMKKKQLDFFIPEETIAKQFEVVQKLPYKFSYKFEDARGKVSTLMIEDWEIGALYWNCLADSEGDEAAALEKVRTKYWGEFVESGEIDLTLILGTTQKFHQMKSDNPFLIIGVFYPKSDRQGDFFL